MPDREVCVLDEVGSSLLPIKLELANTNFLTLSKCGQGSDIDSTFTARYLRVVVPLVLLIRRANFHWARGEGQRGHVYSVSWS